MINLLPTHRDFKFAHLQWGSILQNMKHALTALLIVGFVSGCSTFKGVWGQLYISPAELIVIVVSAVGCLVVTGSIVALVIYLNKKNK